MAVSFVGGGGISNPIDGGLTIDAETYTLDSGTIGQGLKFTAATCTITLESSLEQISFSMWAIVASSASTLTLTTIRVGDSIVGPTTVDPDGTIWVWYTTEGVFHVMAGNQNVGPGSGTVTSVATGTGLTGGPITTTGTISFASVADQRLLANISGGATAPTPNTLTAILDDILGTTQGVLIYRNGTVWTVLTPGTSGQVLTTGGAAANPAWDDHGGVSEVDTGTGLTGGPITSTGTIALADVNAGEILSNLNGIANAPIGHTLTDILDGVFGDTQGSILYRSAGSWALLGPGENGQLLTTQGAGANPLWSNQTRTAIQTYTVVFLLNPSVLGDWDGWRWAFSGTVTSISTQAQGGAGTLATYINSTAITVTPNTISASNNTQVPTGNNTFSTGDYINFVFPTVTSQIGQLIITVGYTY